MKHLATLAIVALFTLCCTTAGLAQMTFGTGGSQSQPEAEITLPTPLTEEAINALVSRLSESEVRALLLDQLNANAAPDAPEGPGEPPAWRRVVFDYCHQ